MQRDGESIMEVGPSHRIGQYGGRSQPTTTEYVHVLRPWYFRSSQWFFPSDWLFQLGHISCFAFAGCKERRELRSTSVITVTGDHPHVQFLIGFGIPNWDGSQSQSHPAERDNISREHCRAGRHDVMLSGSGNALLAHWLIGVGDTGPGCTTEVLYGSSNSEGSWKDISTED
jgi:hypothetical protein